MQIGFYIVLGVIVTLLVVLGVIGGSLWILKLIFDLMDWYAHRKHPEAPKRTYVRLTREEEAKLIEEAINASN